MKVDKNKIRKILVITLSNLGDVVLTTPVVEILVREFPNVAIDVMVGPNGVEVFKEHPGISGLIVYDKFRPLSAKLKLISRLKKEKYSLVVDLRHTLIPYLIRPTYRTSIFQRIPKHITHKKDIHLERLKSVGIDIKDPVHRLYAGEKDTKFIDDLLKEPSPGKLVVVSAGAKSHLKRWRERGFVYVIDRLLKETDARIVLTGNEEEKEVASFILDNVKRASSILDLTGKTTIRQLIELLRRADLLITNDSAPLHIASMLGRRVLALFGPTDPAEYGPFSNGSITLQHPFLCVPCKKAHCSHRHECIRFLREDKVFKAAKVMLQGGGFPHYMLAPKRVLLARTDRIGDVLLSTPTIKAVYDTYLNSYIAFMVGPYAEDIVKGNPCLDEVLIFDKKRRHRGVFGAMRFISTLKKKRFDTAFILHPNNRVHIIAFLAGIPERVGYNKKMGFLLTTKIPHTKQLGQKHESEYTLDVLRAVGIQPGEPKLFMPVNKIADRRVEELLYSKGVIDSDIIVCIHPSASCPSKRWNIGKFAVLAERIVATFNAKVAIVAGPLEKASGDELASHIKRGAVNLSGILSVGELAALLKRSALFISNDSGPVHAAVAVGTPVISIFGRNEKGLSPMRWRPLGKDDVVIHKEVGCKECLAHNCKIGFKCLEKISTQEVLDAVRKFSDRFKK